MEGFDKRYMKCDCEGESKYYCQECRHNLCSLCSDNHKLLPISANHQLHSVEYVQSMTPQQFALLYPPMCSLHHKKLEFYCIECKVPTCMNCIVMEHRVLEGKHTSITISDAFKKFEKISADLEKKIVHHRTKLQEGLDAVIKNDKNLDENKNESLRDIENHIQVMIKIITENGEKLKNSINTMYEEKKEVNGKQMNELNLKISNINTKLNFLHQLLQSDEATAMQLSENATQALMDEVKELPKTQPEDNGQLSFIRSKHQFDLLKKTDIGIIMQIQAACCFELNGPEVVSQGQMIDVEISKTDEIDIDTDQLDATWMKPTGETNAIEVQKDCYGIEFVRVTRSCPGICRLDVSVGGKPIKESPMTIEVEKEGLINTININASKRVTGVAMCEDGCLLVSCLTNEIYNYKPSGEYIDKITLPEDVEVHMMYKRMNGNIVFSDRKCIRVCNAEGLIIKSIGEGILYNPRGIHVIEETDLVYVADYGIGIDGMCYSNDTSQYVLFKLDSGEMLTLIKSHGIGYLGTFYDITVTSRGNLLVADHYNDTVLLLDNEANFLRTFRTHELNRPRGLVVDQDDNIIISSDKNVKMFSMDGKFIKQINKDEVEDGWQLTIISYFPRKIAVANGNDHTVKIFNY